MTTRPTSRPFPPPEPPALRLRDPAGVVAAVPYLLGFVPRRSLVVVGVDVDQGVGATLRTDLPTDDLLGTGPGEVLPAAWAHAGRLMLRNGCSQALVVLYADVDPADLPEAAAARVLGLLAAGGPVREGGNPGPADGLHGSDAPAVLDVLLVGPTAFRSLLCPDPSCCPAEGSPVGPTGSHPVAASFVLAGRNVVAGRDDLEPPATGADPVERDAATAAAVRARGARPAGPSAVLHDRVLLGRWLACLPDGPDPELAGRLACGWRASPMLRDSCLAAFLPGGPDLARALLRSATGTSSGPRAGSAAGSLSRAMADPGAATAVRAGAPVLRRMAALVPAPERAAVVAAHAWLSWASGEGTAASVLAERALDLEPGQSLARLVLQCLDNGLGAPWTGRPPRPRGV